MQYLEGERVSCCKGNNIIRHLLFDHQEGKRAFLDKCRCIIIRAWQGDGQREVT